MFPGKLGFFLVASRSYLGRSHVTGEFPGELGFFRVRAASIEEKGRRGGEQGEGGGRVDNIYLRSIRTSTPTSMAATGMPTWQLPVCRPPFFF